MKAETVKRLGELAEDILDLFDDVEESDKRSVAYGALRQFVRACRLNGVDDLDKLLETVQDDLNDEARVAEEEMGYYY